MRKAKGIFMLLAKVMQIVLLHILLVFMAVMVKLQIAMGFAV